MNHRIIIPGVASRPAGYTRHVATLAGAEYRRSRRNVPMAVLDNRSACYFGTSNFWALFHHGERVGETYSPITAALWLKGLLTY